MAVRLNADSLWRGASCLRAIDSPIQRLRSCHASRQQSRRRSFSSLGTPSLRNASPIASSSSTTLETIATQTSDASISMFEPLTPYVYQLPELLHLPPSAHSYAISIIAATIIIRTCVTLPVSLWQRARMRRLEEIVAPRWEVMKKELPVSVAKRSRKEKKSYKEYEAALKKEVSI
jgi:membrane protein insertase Oxa1/YidC/SpoIIIJ